MGRTLRFDRRPANGRNRRYLAARRRAAKRPESTPLQTSITASLSAGPNPILRSPHLTEMTAFPFASHSRQRSFRSRSSTGVYRLVGSGRTPQNRRVPIGAHQPRRPDPPPILSNWAGGHSSSINPQPIGASPRSDAPAATDCLANHRRRLEHGTEAHCSQDIDALRAMTIA